MANITIYTKSTCPFCVKAKSLLDSKNVTYTEYDIGKQPELRDDMISKANGKTTVPQIFIGEKHIGGCDDLHALDGKGSLDALLA
ncbi:MAG: glutaredoxin 3 [Pseudomonadota bacterium]